MRYTVATDKYIHVEAESEEEALRLGLERFKAELELDDLGVWEDPEEPK